MKTFTTTLLRLTLVVALLTCTQDAWAQSKIKVTWRSTRLPCSCPTAWASPLLPNFFTSVGTYYQTKVASDTGSFFGKDNAKRSSIAKSGDVGTIHPLNPVPAHNSRTLRFEVSYKGCVDPAKSCGASSGKVFYWMNYNSADINGKDDTATRPTFPVVGLVHRELQHHSSDVSCKEFVLTDYSWFRTTRDSGYVTIKGHLEGETGLDSFAYLYFILAGPAGSSNTNAPDNTERIYPLGQLNYPTAAQQQGGAGAGYKRRCF